MFNEVVLIELRHLSNKYAHRLTWTVSSSKTHHTIQMQPKEKQSYKLDGTQWRT